MPFATESGVLEPVDGELGGTIVHILAAKNTEFKHLLGGEFGLEIWMEVAPDRLSAVIDVSLLHAVRYVHHALFHEIVYVEFSQMSPEIKV